MRSINRYQNIRQQPFVSQFAPVDYDFIQQQLDKKQVNINAANKAQADAMAALNSEVAVTEKDREFMRGLKEGTREQFKKIITDYGGDLSAASNDIVSYIGNIRNHKFWNANKANVAAHQRYITARDKYGPKAVEFKAPGSVIDDKGSVRSVEDVIDTNIEERSNSTQIANDVIQHLQANSRYGGSWETGGGFRIFQDYESISDERVKEAAEAAIGEFKQSDPQFFRRILKNNGKYTDENGEEAMRKIDDMGSVVFNGNRVTKKEAQEAGMSLSDYIAKEFIGKAGQDRVYEKRTTKGIRQIPTQTGGGDGRGASGVKMDGGYLQSQQAEEELKKLEDAGAITVKDKEIVQNLAGGIELEYNEDTPWYTKAYNAILSATSYMPGGQPGLDKIREYKRKAMATVNHTNKKLIKEYNKENKKAKNIDHENYVASKNNKGEIEVRERNMWEQGMVNYDVKSIDISDEMTETMANELAGLLPADVFVKNIGDGRYKLVDSGGKPIDKDKKMESIQVAAKFMEENMKEYQPSYTNYSFLNKDGEETTYGKELTEQLGFSDYNKKERSSSDKDREKNIDKLDKSIVDRGKIETGTKNITIINGPGDIENKSKKRSWSETINAIKNSSEVDAIGAVKVVGSSNQVLNSSPINAIEISYTDEDGDLQNMQISIPNEYATKMDYLEAYGNNLSKGNALSEGIYVAPLDNNAQEVYDNIPGDGESKVAELSRAGQNFVQIRPKIDKDGIIRGYEPYINYLNKTTGDYRPKKFKYKELPKTRKEAFNIVTEFFKNVNRKKQPQEDE